MTTGRPSRFVLRDEHGRFIYSRPTLREAEREARRASVQWPIVVVCEEDPHTRDEEMVLLVRRDPGSRSPEVTRHGRLV